MLLRAGLRHRQEQWRGAPSWKGTQVTGAPAERTGKGPGKACSESPPRLTAHLCLGGGNTEHPSTPRPVSPPQEPLGVPHGPGDGWFRVGLSHRGRSILRAALLLHYHWKVEGSFGNICKHLILAQCSLPLTDSELCYSILKKRISS